MNVKRFIYVVEAYAYSDFETHILTHNENYTVEEFKQIVENAQKRTKTVSDTIAYDYSSKLLHLLITDYGFEYFNYPCVHIGCDESYAVEYGYSPCMSTDEFERFLKQ